MHPKKSAAVLLASNFFSQSQLWVNDTVVDLSSHVPVSVLGTGTFPERGTTLMKDFYTKLFPERSRSRSGTWNEERGHVPRSRLLCC